VKRWPLLLVAIAAVLGLWLLTRLVSQGFEEVARAEAERTALEHRKAELEQRVRDLDATLHALRCDPAAVESMARQELGWVRPGEVVVLIATPTPPRRQS
jgi:cell division protein FtsB